MRGRLWLSRHPCEPLPPGLRCARGRGRGGWIAPSCFGVRATRVFEDTEGRHLRSRPRADIGPFSESARSWGMSRCSCPVRAHHSKRSFRFFTSTFLTGCLGPTTEVQLLCCPGWSNFTAKETAQRLYSHSSSFSETKMSTTSIVIAARNALGTPFHCWACHIPNHSPATATKPPS